MYQALFLINRSFHFIVQRLHDLENSHKLSQQHFAELRGLTQEVQRHIDNRLIEEIHTVERADWYHLGEIRTAMEKRLDPENREQVIGDRKPG